MNNIMHTSSEPNATLPILDAATIAALQAGFNEPTHTASPAVHEDKPMSLHGDSAPMRSLVDMIGKVAPTRANILIVGESGTGKELVAQTIFRMSKQGRQPFIAINCGAIPASLIEAELFGHERGSFTGAVRSHRGVFERAAGGTLFLDEVTEMPMSMQVKLLRVLETGKFYRVGGDEEITANVRVIAATNRNPDQAVAEGLLRADLLYRLAVFPLQVPPLRERGKDTELLADLFIESLNAEEGTDKSLSNASRRFLREYSWPGNVRELKNVVHRAFILADDQLELTTVVAPKPQGVPETGGNFIPVKLGTPLAEVERSMIHATLDLCEGNKKQTARILGVSLKTLYNRLNEYRATESRLETIADKFA